MRGSVDTSLAGDRADLGRVPAKAREQLAGGAEHAVDRLDHRRRIAARVIAGEDAAVEPFAHEPRGRFEHARLGAAESVDALLRVADDEDARRPLPARAAARAGIAREPAVQRMPLQRARVLELVDQQMGDARVEPLLDPARQLAVAQQDQRDALEIGHVGEALRPLVVGERGEQRAAEANHAQMLLARFVLMDLIGQVLERVLHRFDERQASARTRAACRRSP